MAADPNAAAIEQQAASGTGIPVSVEHQQAVAESGEQDIATSSAGAQGFWQFLPSTYNSLAAQAGVPQGSWNNVADETKVYIVYMNQLLQQEGGSIFKALEAYNAGPGNLPAGSGYASGIMSKAGVAQSATAGQAADLTGIHIPNPLNIPGDIGKAVLGNVGGIFHDVIKGLLDSLGVPTLKDMFQRLALILFGAALVFVGIRVLVQSGGSKQAFNIQTSNTADESGTVTKSRTVKTPLSKHTSTKAIGAGDAIEAAAAA